MRTQYYIFIMAFAVGITFVRSLALAALMPSTAFAMYATIVAAGMFASNLLSFGLIERTYKAYPRLWADCKGEEARSQCDAGIWILFLRFLVSLPISVIFCLLVHLDIFIGLGVACIAFGVATIGICVSLHRATTEVYSLSLTTLARSMLSIVLALSGAFLFGLYGAILGEVVAAVAGAFISRVYVAKLVVQQLNRPLAPKEIPESSERDTKGRWVFFGFLAVAAPIYLDRSFVTASFDGANAGTYAFLSLFIMAANTLVGIFAQKVGPELIHLERVGKPTRELLGYALRWVVLFWSVWLIGIFLAALLLIEGNGILGSFSQKYHLNFALFCTIAIIGFFQVTVFFDFILLSQDRERSLFIAALSFLVITIIACGITYLFKPSLFVFLSMLALAKFVHACVQLAFIFSPTPPQLSNIREWRV